MMEQKKNVPEAHFVCVGCDRFVIGDVISECWADVLQMIYCVSHRSDGSLHHPEMD